MALKHHVPFFLILVLASLALLLPGHEVAHSDSFTVVGVFVFIGTWISHQITDAITPMRVTEEDEALGLDVSQHNERL